MRDHGETQYGDGGIGPAADGRKARTAAAKAKTRDLVGTSCDQVFGPSARDVELGKKLDAMSDQMQAILVSQKDTMEVQRTVIESLRIMGEAQALFMDKEEREPKK